MYIDRYFIFWPWEESRISVPISYRFEDKIQVSQYRFYNLTKLVGCMYIICEPRRRLLSRYSSQLSAASENADFILCELFRVYVVLFRFFAIIHAVSLERFRELKKSSLIRFCQRLSARLDREKERQREREGGGREKLRLSCNASLALSPVVVGWESERNAHI